jgi:hypothetical protein
VVRELTNGQLCLEDATKRLISKVLSILKDIETSEGISTRLYPRLLQSDLQAFRNLRCTITIYAAQKIEPEWKAVRDASTASGQYLITDTGVLDVSFLRLSPDPLERLRTLFVSNDWVAEEGANILWLPPDYRATRVAVRGGMIVLGHSSGSISFLEFEFAKGLYTRC